VHRLEPPYRRVLLPYALGRIKSRTEGDISRRDLQQEFNRSNGRLVSKHLSGLVRHGWLSVRKKSRGVYATRYSSGRRFARSPKLRKDWLELSACLFGDSGLLSNLFSRSAFGPGFLGVNGLLVVSTLNNSLRPLSAKELHQYLGFFMSRQTINNVLLKLAKHLPVLAIKSDGLRDCTNDVLNALQTYETTRGPNIRSKKTRAGIQFERAEHGVRVKRGLLTPADEKRLKTSCIRSKTHKKPFEVEHFPPKKFLRAWLQGDHIDLSWGICADCNNRYGHWIKKQSAPILDTSTPIKITIKAGFDIRRVVIARLETNLRHFYKSVDSGNDSKALKLIVDAYRLWLAVIKAEIPIHVTQIHADGSIESVFLENGKSVRKRTGELGERKISSKIARRWPDGPARRIQQDWQN
jgi:hypothetical protein